SLEPNVHLVQRAGGKELKPLSDRIQVTMNLVRPECIRGFPEHIEVRIRGTPVLAVMPDEVGLRIVRTKNSLPPTLTVFRSNGLSLQRTNCPPCQLPSPSLKFTKMSTVIPVKC